MKSGDAFLAELNNVERTETRPTESWRQRVALIERDRLDAMFQALVLVERRATREQNGGSLKALELAFEKTLAEIERKRRDA